MPHQRSRSLPEPLIDEESRLAELRCYGTLDTEREPIFDDLARLAAQLCGTPIAAISLLDRDREWLKASVGITATELPRASSACQHTIGSPDLLIVPDAWRDPRFRDSPIVTGGPRIRFYAGAPLRSPSGQGLGALCVLDRRPRRLDAGQKEGLRALARQVIALLEIRRAADERARAEKALRESEERFQKFMTSGPANAYIKDAAGRFVYVNEPLARCFQIPVEEWIGRTDAEMVGEENASKVVEHDLTVLNDERTVVAEEAVPTPDGSAQCWLSYKFLLYDATGQKQVGGLSFDITARKAAEHERERLVSELREALAEVKALSGLLPICSWCKKIRDDAGYWQQIESYLSKHSELEFTHGICPDCLGEMYPDFVARQQTPSPPSSGPRP